MGPQVQLTLISVRTTHPQLQEGARSKGTGDVLGGRLSVLRTRLGCHQELSSSCFQSLEF